MKDILKWAMIPLAVLLYIANDRFKSGPADTAPAVAVDQVAVKLGQDYRTAFDAAGQAALDAIPNGTATTADGLFKGQRDALQAALSAAASPIDAESTRRFGAFSATSSPSPDLIRAFYRDIAAGYRKGGAR